MRSSSRPLLNMPRSFLTAGGGPLDFPLESICRRYASQHAQPRTTMLIGCMQSCAGLSHVAMKQSNH